jgi:predicted negative regulator of RcsB-dependent stress response
MAALDLQEQEQVDALKHWWKDNGKKLTAALTVALLGFAGFKGWQYYQNKQSADASRLYGEVLKQLASGDAKRVSDAAAAVAEKYGSTAYASRAQLLAAQVNETVGSDLARAQSQLEWIVAHAGEESLQSVARLHLGALLLDQKNYAAALEQANAKHAASFDGLFADLKGDILNAQGKTAEAKAAYKLAFDKTDANNMYRNLIQIKLDALGGA